MVETGGTKIGTMFAEIDLDRSKYDAGLDRALSDGKSVSIDVEKAWRTMGSKSTGHVDKMRANVVNAYELIKNKSTSTTADILRAEIAAKNKMAQINKKFYGGTVTNIKEVENTARRATGVFTEMFSAFTLANVATDAMYALGRSVKEVFTDAFNSVEEFKLSSASLGATIATFAKTDGKDMAEVYRQSYAYAEQLNLKMEEWNAKTVATGENLRAMVETMAQAGIVVDVNNKAQEKGIIAIANALAIVTKGQEQDKQFRQETRGLLDGEVRFTNRLAVMIDSMVEGPLTKQVDKWRESGTLVENLGTMLTGFSAATKDLEQTWLAVSTTAETVYHRVLRGMFVPVYEDIVSLSRDITLSMLDQEREGSELANILRNSVYKAWVDIKNISRIAGDTINAFERPLRFMGKLLGLSADGWGLILAAATPVYHRLMDIVAASGTIVNNFGAIQGLSSVSFKMLRGDLFGAISDYKEIIDKVKVAWATQAGDITWGSDAASLAAAEAGKAHGKRYATSLVSEMSASLNEYNEKLENPFGNKDVNAPEMAGGRAGSDQWAAYEKSFQNTINNTISAKEKELEAYRKIENAKPEIIAAAEAQIQTMQDKAHKAELKRIESEEKAYTKLIKSTKAAFEKKTAENLASIPIMTEAQIIGLEARTYAEREAYEESVKIEQARLESVKDALEEERELREEAYKDFSDTTQDNVAEILKTEKDKWEAIQDIMKDALIEMAAEALTTKIIVPIALDIGSAMGLSWNGVSMSSMAGGASGAGSLLSSGGDLLTSGSSLWNAYSGKTSAMVLNGLETLGLTGTSAAMAGGGASAGMLFPGATSGAVPAAFGGTGVSTFATGLAAAAPYLAAATAVLTFMGSDLNPFGGDDTPEIGLYGKGFFQETDYTGQADDRTAGEPYYVGDPKYNEQLMPIDISFSDIGDTAGKTLAESVDTYLGGILEDLSADFGLNLTETFEEDHFKVKVKIEDFETAGELLVALGDKLFVQGSTELVGQLMQGYEDVFTNDFFQSIQTETETLFDTFARFANVASMENFGSRIDTQMAGGATSVQAYQNLEAIDAVLASAGASIELMTSSSTMLALENIIDTSDMYIDTMEDLSATQEELAKIQIALAQEVGAVITGLNANTLQSGIFSIGQTGGDLTATLQENFKQTMAQIIAGMTSESIMETYVSGLNEQIGNIVNSLSGSRSTSPESLSNILSDIMDGFDWEGLENSTAGAIDAINNLIGANQTLADTDWFPVWSDKQKLLIQIMELEGDTAEALALSRKIELDSMNGLLQPYQQMVWALSDVGDAADETIGILEKSMSSVGSTIDSIMGGSDAAVLSKNYFETKYATLLSGAQADPANVSEFTSFATKYLDFMEDYGSPGITEGVLADLTALQSDMTQEMTTLELSGGKSLADLFETLVDIEANTADYGQSQLIADQIVNEATVYDAYAGIGRTGFGDESTQIDQAGFDYWVDRLTTGALTLASFPGAFDAAADGPSFDGGGTISGPLSGYTVPTTFHGIEHVNTDADMQFVKASLAKLVSTSGGGNIQVKVFVGSKELKDLTFEVINTDSRVQSVIKKVAHV